SSVACYRSVAKAPSTSHTYTPSLHDALPICLAAGTIMKRGTPEQRERWALDLLTFDKIGAWAITEPGSGSDAFGGMQTTARKVRSEEHTSELQSRENLVCRLLLEKKKKDDKK